MYPKMKELEKKKSEKKIKKYIYIKKQFPICF